MKNKVRSIFTILFLNLGEIDIAQAFQEKKLHHNEVLLSTDKNYPQILSYYEKVNAAKASNLASLGFFDIKLKHSYLDKSRGFYDGKITDNVLEKELGFMGVKVYGGYRRSFGSFPVYEGESITNSNGEYRIGAKFSLLKDSTIDQDRLKVILSNLSLEESKIQLEAIKKQIERDATKAYWKWVTTAKIFHIYEDLYQLSLKRQSQLEEKLKKGDVAQIVVVENKKNILRRKNAMLNVGQDFENAAIYLSLFWRDNNGASMVPKINQVPEVNFSLDKIENAQDLQIAMVKRPELRILKIQKEQNSNQLKYAQNLFKPQLDFDLGASKDLGSGPISRAQANHYVGLNFSIPLQQREARGKSVEYKSKLKSLKLEQQLLEEKIKVEIEQMKIQISTIVEMHHNLVQESKLAILIENSEREKLHHGYSNLFLVNLREQDTALAKAALIEMFEKYQNILADYKMAVFSN